MLDSPSHPFSKTRVDFESLFIDKERNCGTEKLLMSNIEIFICFSTRTIHLELFFNFSNSKFLVSWKRFVAGRGRPSE